MASYDVEHSVPTPPHRHSTRRPDLSTFFSNLNSATPDPSTPRNRPDAVPVPADVSALYRQLAEGLEMMRRQHDGRSGDNAHPITWGPGEEAGGQNPFSAAAQLGAEDSETVYGDDLVSNMIVTLLHGADMPPADVEGVDEAWCEELERVPKKKLTKDMNCPICNEPFLDDEYPLVVRLPCHKDHLFDMECVRPWLRLRGTCPLDRKDFGKEQRLKREERRKALEKANEEDGEEEWDGLYG